VRLTFLGSGTSFGIPVIGCECEVCASHDVRNRRTRHSLLIEREGARLLIDTPPELRLQLTGADVGHLDAVYITHPHADHVHGIDDLRIFSVRERHPLPVYVPAEYQEEMRARFAYVWGPGAAAEEGTTIPELEMIPFVDREQICPGGVPLVPIAFPHGRYRSYGFRCGDLGVVVDAKRIPADAWELLGGVRYLVINALWHGSPHPTHFNVEEAVAAARRIGAAHTYLTHLTHRLDHAELEAWLPDGMQPAYDGLTIEI